MPFDVPAGTETLRLRYSYDRANGDNVIDLGLFEPGPLDLGTRAFRGYSGGARFAVTISAAETTPGYRPGPIPAGQWHVLLGLYKVGNAGVEVTIDIETEGVSGRSRAEDFSHRSGEAAPSELPRRRSEAAKAEWYMGALHTHTLHSDGTVTPLELMRMMAAAKFDFVAITDHNNTTHRHELAPLYSDHVGLPLWIVGEEVTTPGGHANVWGLKGDAWVDFRVSPQDGRIHELVKTTRQFGALFAINHPVSECSGCGWRHEIVDGIDAIEISNGRHGEVGKALEIWDRVLMSGRRMTGVGSSDWHSAPNSIDQANVRVYASSLSEAAILDAIRQGRVIIMTSGRDATPDIVLRRGSTTARIGETLVAQPGSLVDLEIKAPGFAGAQLALTSNGVRGALTTLDAAGEIRLTQRVSPGYVRLEIFDSNNVRAVITNPVYVRSPDVPNGLLPSARQPTRQW